MRVSACAGGTPLISESMSKGELSFSKDAAITRVATSASGRKLLELARTGRASQVERVDRAWKKVDSEDETDEAKRLHEQRYLRDPTDTDGSVVIHARLPPEQGAGVLSAIRVGEDLPYVHKRQEKDAAAKRTPSRPYRFPRFHPTTGSVARWPWLRRRCRRRKGPVSNPPDPPSSNK